MMKDYRLHNGGINTILPDILDVAEKHGLNLRKVQHRNEYRANCPFCGDKKRKLYINPDKNTFNCYHGSCPSNSVKNGGGVVKFLALLNNMTETQVLEELKESARQSNNKNKPKKPSHPVFRHPARHISAFQLEFIGFKGPSWYQLMQLYQQGKVTLDYIQRQLNYLWQEWKAFVQLEREFALMQLYGGIYECRYKEAVELIKKREEETGIELLEPALKLYSQPNQSKRLLEIRKAAYDMYLSCRQQKQVS